MEWEPKMEFQGQALANALDLSSRLAQDPALEVYYFIELLINLYSFASEKLLLC